MGLVKFLYNSKFDLAAKSLVTNSRYSEGPLYFSYPLEPEAFLSAVLVLLYLTKPMVQNSLRVATVREKYLENEFFSRPGKSQGIFWMVKEI